METDAASGRWIITRTGTERVRAFVPARLLPEGLDLVPHLELMSRADRALGRLDGLASLLPDASLLVYMYIRKEAVLSSQIEGTQSSLTDLLTHEMDGAPGVPRDDLEEVSQYVAAIQHGLSRLAEGFPLSKRLLREIHEVLLSSGRGSRKQPGQFRRSQNWIGGSRPGDATFVPPPPDEVEPCMDELERFLHDGQTPLLLKAALAHVQFETIHPFLDGNGRLGRLLITLLMCSEGALREPVLYLSLHFKQHRARYYDLLQKVRLESAWGDWLRFFFEGVLQTATQAVNTAHAALQLFEADRQRIREDGRAIGSTLQVHEALQRHPLLSIARGAELTGRSGPTVSKALQRLIEMGVVTEVTGRERGQLFVYKPYIDLLDQGTEPLR